MRVLLVGEYSCLHKYLKEGLKECGADVTLIADEDGWKKIGGATHHIHKKGSNRFSKAYYSHVYPLSQMSIYTGYDVVQFINTLCFGHLINGMMVSRIGRKSCTMSLVAAGYDLKLYQKYKEGFFDYYMMDEALNVQKAFDKSSLKGLVRGINDNLVLKKVNVVIPSAYEYKVGYDDCGKVCNVIPFPINIDSLEYRDNIVRDKIVFFHGLNREIEKGTKYIKEALKKLEQNYPNDVEIIIDGHMPFEEYKKCIERTNVVIDQCKSYGYGMNACISMALGKVVLSGKRPEHLDSLGVTKCPIIEIVPDSNQIYRQLEYIVKNKNNIKTMGKKGRKYVEDVHDYKKVAKQYMREWEKTLRK